MAEVPWELRGQISGLLDSLIRGDLPERLVWVRQYGPDGATLVPQPEGIWTHQRTEITRKADGGWHVALPLWTAEEAPSDLTAEIVVDPNGQARLTDVHVL